MTTLILNNQNKSKFFENLDKKKQIQLEKRNRFHIYTMLDYSLSAVSYFDFFSRNAFEVVLRTKLLAQIFEKEKVSCDFLLFTFLDSNNELTTILDEYGLEKSIINKYLISSYNVSKKTLPEKIFGPIPFFAHSLLYYFNKTELDIKISFSHDMNLLFEKAAENAISRFKTPVITSEILFLTMMEDKKSKIGKLILHFLSSSLDWYLLRYKLLKIIHHQETKIRNDIKKSEKYFAYLLKTQIPEDYFTHLIDSNYFPLGILYFRAFIINRLFSCNLYQILDYDINKSIQKTSTRMYSSEI